MAMLNLGFGFIANYWRDIAIGIIVAALGFITVSWWGQAVEIGRLKTQLTMAAQQNETLQTKVSAYEQAEETAKENIAKADKNRQEIINVLTKEINKVRNQPIPKDCNGAVAYGIKFKDDMKWPQETR